MLSKIKNFFKSLSKEAHFKVNVGKGVELKTYYQMKNLSSEERDFLFRNAEKCASFDEEVEQRVATSVVSMDSLFLKSTNFNENLNLSCWNTENMSALRSLGNMTEKQKQYCIENNIVEVYPIIGAAAIIDSNIKEYFNSLY